MLQILPFLLLAFTAVVFLFVASPRVVLAAGFGVWAMNGTTFVNERGWTAICGMGVILVAAFKSSASGRRPAPITYLPIAIAAWGLLVSPLSADPRVSALQSLMLASLGLVTFMVASRFDGREVCVAAYTILMACSLASYFAPERGLRWNGIFDNGNYLGLVAFALISVSFGVGTRAVLAASVVSIPLLVMSASRGGALASVAAWVVGTWVSASSGSSRASRRGTAIRLGVVTTIALGGWVLIGVLERSRAMQLDTGLFRTTDSSRAFAVATSWQAFLEGPRLGYGIGVGVAPNLQIGAHTQFITLAVMFGVIGLAIFGVTAVMLLKLPWRESPPLAALIAAAFVSWLTESWMLGAGSVISGIFWTTVAALGTDMQGRGGDRIGQTAKRGTSGSRGLKWHAGSWVGPSPRP